MKQRKSNCKILVASSVHQWNDPRVFYKETLSLAKYYSVSLIAVAKQSAFMAEGVPVEGLPLPRFAGRRLRNHLRILSKGLKGFDVIHIHDPELLWVGLIFTFLNRRVVYDRHEDVYSVLKRKGRAARIVGKWFYGLERICVHRFSGFIIAEASYRRHFNQRSKLCLVRNYTLVNPEPLSSANCSPFTVLYVGKLSEVRGTIDVVRAVQKVREKGVDLRLTLVGTTRDARLQAQLASWKEEYFWLEWTGWLAFKDMEPWIKNASLGVVPLHPEPNYLWSFPTKIFDYMNWGLPYIYADLPINHRFFGPHKGGVEFQAGNIDDLAEKIYDLCKHPERVKELASKARESVHRFSWVLEERKLLQLYRSLLS